MKSTAIYVLSSLLLFNIATSEDDLCENVRFVKKRVSLRCCQVENGTLENETPTTMDAEDVTIKFNGILFKCEDLKTAGGDDKKPRMKVGKIVTPKSYEASRKNESEKRNITIPNLRNRNFGDVPGRCPEGMVEDHDGECAEVWD